MPLCTRPERMMGLVDTNTCWQDWNRSNVDRLISESKGTERDHPLGFYVAGCKDEERLTVFRLAPADVVYTSQRRNSGCRSIPFGMIPQTHQLGCSAASKFEELLS